MATRYEYADKFESFRGRTLYESLCDDDRAFLRRVAFEFRLTFQEFRRLAETARDLSMWNEERIEAWWEAGGAAGKRSKGSLLQSLNERVDALKRRPTSYDRKDTARALIRRSKPVVVEQSEKTIWGPCPVASEKTVCCNLRTIDAVENCVFGCSYCTVQTFYTDNVILDANFAAKLKTVDLDPGRFYHFGTGQASDSLAWGNKNGVLDALFSFAADHPNVLLEFKTKSDHVRYFLQHDVPRNIVCSWSLNTPTIIENEEHFTAPLDRRLDAARAVADRGVGVAFHFHPMVYYAGWDEDYPDVASRVIDRFDPAEVRFLSFGSVTLIKPAIREIRQTGNPTKILQAEFVSDPHGKQTYHDDIKIEMFSTMHQSFAAWQTRVFTYLCMETRSIWERSFGYVYDSNEEFEAEFGRMTMPENRRRT